MREHIQKIGFELSTSGRDDGTIEAVYIQMAEAPVSSTKEIIPDILLADYAEDGQLVGIEILARVKVSRLEELIEKRERRQSFRNFVERSAPRDLVEV